MLHSGRGFGVWLIVLICLNVVAVILGTIEAVAQRIGPALAAFEVFSVVVFTIEYVLRLWSCTADPRFRHPFLGRVRYALTPMALVDLAAILPFYLPVRADLRFARVLRLMRIFRVLKLARYVRAMELFADVARTKREELVLTTAVLALLLVMAASLIYFAENEAQPEVFSSIPASAWWAVTTLTTVGYGDTYPITPFGRVLGAVVAILGIGLFALPTAILGAGFVQAIEQRKTRPSCPHCGKPLA